MKKIKWLLIFWLFAIFWIGSSFALTWINSIFSYIDSSNWQTAWYLVWVNNSLRFWVSPFYWFSTWLVTFNTLASYFPNTIIHPANVLLNTQSFSNPLWFSISVENTWWSIESYNFWNLDDLLFSRVVDYSTWDSFPIIIWDNWKYLTFSWDKNIIYNWQNVLTLTDVNYLHYCFYWIDYSLSCLFSTNSNSQWFIFKSFFDSIDWYLEYNNFAVVPIHEKIDWTQYNSNFFTWWITLVLGYWNFNNNNSQWIIYNLYNCYSSNPEVLKSCNLNSKWYININSDSFFRRLFLSLMWNFSNVSNHWYWSFSDVIYSWWHFYFRSNWYYNIFSTTATSSTQSKNNCYGFSSCFWFSELPLQNDDSVVNLLSWWWWSQSTWSMAINTWLMNLCLTSDSFYTLNYSFCNLVFWGRDLSYYQWLLQSWAYLQSYIDWSWNLVYVIDIYDEPSTLTWTSVVWDCYWDRCINTQSWSWWDVSPWDIVIFSWGEFLSSWYYSNFFESINKTWYFFQCPYSYNDSRWVAWRAILTAIWKDPFLPVNCFIAAYENWRRIKLFDDAFHWFSFGPLMSWDSQNHRNLFSFFDILLSTALIFFLMKFYHLFK